MLYWLAKRLTEQASFFNLFSYLTLRAILAAVSALAEIGRASCRERV